MATPGLHPDQVVLPHTLLHKLDASNIPNQPYEVRVWLPPSYPEAPERRYPTLYMPDGDYCFAMAVDVVRYLVQGTLAPEIIVVGIGYGSDRPPQEGGKNMRARDLAPYVTDMTPEPRAEAFRLFLEGQLVPLIESTYRADPEFRAFYGFSLGGLFGLYLMLHSLGLFRRYVLVSPALMPSTAHVIDQISALALSSANHPLSVYTCIGELEVFIPFFTRLADVLEKWSIGRFRFEREVFKRGVHMTAPAEALAKGIRMTFGGRSICEAMYEAYKRGGMEAAGAQYRDFKERADPDYNFGESELNNLGYVLLFQEKIDDAIEVFKMNVEAYPQAWNAYDSLGEAYLAAGNLSLARVNYEISVQLNPKNEAGIAQLKKLGPATVASTTLGT